MDKKNLQRVKFASNWGGVIVTFTGILINIRTNGSIHGNILSITGICITIIGHLVTHAVDKYENEERKKYEDTIDSLENRVAYTEEYMEDPVFNEVINEAKIHYFERHQDDGR